MKKVFSICLIGVLCLALHGCGYKTETEADSKNDKAVTQTTPAIEAESTEQPAAGTQLLSERSIEEFKFEGRDIEDPDGRGVVTYREITKESVKKALWDIICEQEKKHRFQEEGGEVGNSFELKLTDQTTGEVIYVGYGIYYESPYVDGGPPCFVISGSNIKIYYTTEDEQTFTKLIEEGVVCD